MVKSMSEAINASITSPEQGAQQECSSNLLSALGSSSLSRFSPVISIILTPLGFRLQYYGEWWLVANDCSLYIAVCKSRQLFLSLYVCKWSIFIVSKNSFVK